MPAAQQVHYQRTREMTIDELLLENRIVFVITSRREGVAFNFSEDWRFMAAPLGEAVGRQSLATALMTRAGPNDF